MSANSQSKNTKGSFIFQISLATSLILIVLGIIITILANTPGLLLVGILSTLIGSIQLLADTGWLAIIKINQDLGSWREAFNMVVKQREQKFFLYPIYIDVLFISLSLGTILKLNL